MTRDQMHNTLRYVREQLAEERGSDFSGVKALDLVLEELEQEPKTGHWIKQSENVNRCSECELMVFKTSINYYCPRCGAKMVEPQESEDME